MGISSCHASVLWFNIFLIISSYIILPMVSLECNSRNCRGRTYYCSGSGSCTLNCNADNSCQNTELDCWGDNLHDSPCTVNCYGESSCSNLVLVSSRDTVINCIGMDACDGLIVDIYGDDAYLSNDAISATLTSSGSYSDTISMNCHNDGISECNINCVDNGGFYTCLDVDLHCHTSGMCTHHCDANACCGCSLSCGILCTTSYVNELNCYQGRSNCIQVMYSVFVVFELKRGLK